MSAAAARSALDWDGLQGPLLAAIADLSHRLNRPAFCPHCCAVVQQRGYDDEAPFYRCRNGHQWPTDHRGEPIMQAAETADDNPGQLQEAS
jgi:hypothetical protein